MSLQSQSFESTASVSEDKGFAPDEARHTSTYPCELIGDSAATRRVRLQIDRIGPHFRTVLVQGEMGCGKELIARSLHARAGSAAGPFLCCHGAAFVTESPDASPNETFRQHQSSSPWQMLSSSRTATIFIDAIDEVPLAAQPRLLELMGQHAHERPSLRIIAAAGQNLRRLIAAGRFRSDLYHRLATIEILIEPLRRRPEDIPGLARHMVARYASVYGKGTIALASDTIERLQQHNWPGNVREMEDVLRNAVLELSGNLLESQHLGSLTSFPPLEKLEAISHSEPTITSTIDFPRQLHSDVPSKPAQPARLQNVVEQHVLHVLRACSGNKVRAAEVLGISRSTLYRMLDGCAASGRMEMTR